MKEMQRKKMISVVKHYPGHGATKKDSHFLLPIIFKSQKKLEILETKVLGNRQFLCVVAYEKQRILLGASPNGLQFLCSLDSDQTQISSSKNL